MMIKRVLEERIYILTIDNEDNKVFVCVRERDQIHKYNIMFFMFIRKLYVR